jgi:hypothetical protein
MEIILKDGKVFEVETLTIENEISIEAIDLQIADNKLTIDQLSKINSELELKKIEIQKLTLKNTKK